MADVPRRASRRAEPEGDESRIRMFKDAYDEGKRAVDDQISELDSMRQKSVQFVAFVGSATAFLVGTGLAATKERPGTYYWLAGTSTALSALSVVLLTAVLLGLVWARTDDDDKASPKRLIRARWDFRNSARVLVESRIDPEVEGLSERKYYRDLALIYDRKAERNDVFLVQVRRSYWLLLVGGTAQLIGWSAVVWMFA